ncbi:zinc finger protein 2-like [Rhinatrema bivittatum]|uniref:zinc finger protein 2-like n=1 Tax=Rhinatrema bivittatum TaxID=194408 RepID=UPI00112AD7E6|nr:zinc finger protein 2-like [Rhinatrema bivittatum]
MSVLGAADLLLKRLTFQDPVTFEDIAVSFSQEEWEDLGDRQKELYQDVMKENYQTLISLGTSSLPITPDIISHMERREELYIRDEPGSEERETGRSSCSAETNVPQNTNTEKHRWEFTANPEGNKMPSANDREGSSYSNWVEKCENQCTPEKKQKHSLGASVKPRRQSSLCDICGMILCDPAILKLHHGSYIEERPSSCSNYGESFIKKREPHEQAATHSIKMLFTCSECGDSFDSQGALVQHEKIHSRDRQFSYIDCGRSLIMYQAKSPSRRRPFSCFECDRRFWQEEDLITHYINHTNKKLFPCKQCGKSFSWKRHLTEHERIHFVNLRD